MSGELPRVGLLSRGVLARRRAGSMAMTSKLFAAHIPESGKTRAWTRADGKKDAHGLNYRIGGGEQSCGWLYTLLYWS
jgi:hypothetical protein